MDEETIAWLDEREKVRVEANRQLSNSDFAAMQEHEDRERMTFNHRIPGHHVRARVRHEQSPEDVRGGSRSHKRVVAADRVCGDRRKG